MASPQVNLANQQESLKDKNKLYLYSFIGINLAIFLSILISQRFSSASIDELWKRVTTRDGILAAGIPVLAIVLTGVFSDVMEARFVFWRWRNPLPGSRAFTQLIKTDPRIDIPALKRKVGEFPRPGAEQNALWFQLYRRHSDSLTVSQAHRFYLLTRDMTSSSVVFLPIFTVSLAMDSVGWKTLSVYGALLCAQYVIIAAAARNYGVRFVLNVLTEESHSKD